MKAARAILVSLLLVLAGCGSGSVGTPVSPTETTAVDDSTSEADVDADRQAADQEGLSFTLHTRESEEAKLVVVVTADTTAARDSDVLSDGDPVFTVQVDGEEVARTEQVGFRDGTFEVQLPNGKMAEYGGTDVEMSVTLWDEDIGSDDRLASNTRTVQIPTISTPTVTATRSAPQTATTDRETTGTMEPTAAPQTATASPTSPTAPDSTPTQTASQSERTEWRVTVVEVVDGDTFEVRFPDGHTENVRLLGVDTPEVHTSTNPDEWEGIPDTESGRAWLEDWGHKASEFARTEVSGEEITIRTDDEADRRGSYGRLLVYAYHDGGQFFNRELLDQGYARLYDSQFSKRDSFAAAEETAQSNDVGVWNYESSRTPTATPVPDGGQSQSLSVAEVHADAEGDDHENLNDEYVVFENTGDSELSLSGWTVTDEGDKHSYTFPSVTLAPGETVTLHTGSGSDDESHLYWGENQAVWNNNGDTVHVTDDSGRTVIQYQYE